MDNRMKLNFGGEGIDPNGSMAPHMLWHNYFGGMPTHTMGDSYRIALFGEEEDEDALKDALEVINESATASHSTSNVILTADDKQKIYLDFIRQFFASSFPDYEECHIHMSYESKNNLYYIQNYFKHINLPILIHFTKYNSYALSVDFLSLSEGFEEIRKINQSLANYCKSFEPVKQEGKSYINFICNRGNGFYLEQFDVTADVDLDHIFDNYEDDFKTSFSDVIIKKLNSHSCNKGLVLLHGVPGTGKTTYLRYILSQIKNKKVMYLPPEYGNSLSDPNFITFLMANPNSVLIIEDAENILKTREAGYNQAVSNILNITDGILGSALKYQIICTFNAEYTEIDTALTRKGRLLGEYKFEALSKEKTAYLVHKLYGVEVDPIEPRMTLGDIHSMEDFLPKTPVASKKSFGFVP